MSAPHIARALDLGDPLAVADLRTFLSRARTVDDGAVRLQAVGRVLAVYVCVLRPRALGEPTPTVLGLRTIALAAPADADVTVSIASVFDRLARMGEQETVLDVPPSEVREAWAAVSAPRGPWQPAGEVTAAAVEAAASEGMAEVAGAVPAQPGAAVVHTVRAGVWGRDLPGSPGLPAGVAFAATALGFVVPGETLLRFDCGPWVRLSSTRGHVLARKPSTLAG